MPLIFRFLLLLPILWQVWIVAPAIVFAGAAIYTLGPGDRVYVTVFGELDLSGEFEINSNGALTMPLIGEISAAGYGVQELEQSIIERLSEGFLKNPMVNIEVVTYRPFFILGEVKKPGSYPYVNGLVVLEAVALAGGYTFRADRTRVTIARGDGGAKGRIGPASEDAVVLPGDIVRVGKREF